MNDPRCYRRGLELVSLLYGTKRHAFNYPALKKIYKTQHADTNPQLSCFACTRQRRRGRLEQDRSLSRERSWLRDWHSGAWEEEGGRAGDLGAKDGCKCSILLGEMCANTERPKLHSAETIPLSLTSSWVWVCLSPAFPGFLVQM